MQSNRQHLLDIVAVAASMGLTLFVAVCIGIFLGNTLDKFLGTTPWFLIIGALLGAVSGFWSLYKKALTYMKEEPGSGHDDDNGK